MTPAQEKFVMVGVALVLVALAASAGLRGPSASSPGAMGAGSGPFGTAAIGSGLPSGEARLSLVGDWHVEEGQYGTSSIVGIIRNNTDREVGYAQVTFALMDRDGNQVGTALDNIAGLAPGGTWKFHAAILDMEGRVRSARLTNITGF